MLNINFDVTMLDMSCDHVTVGVWDACRAQVFDAVQFP